MQAITPDYFRTMQIPLLGGREFTDGDRDGQLPVVIVSRSFARRFWPNGNAVGKRIGYPFPSPWMTIVGIAADVRADSLRDTTAISVYLPWRQRSRLSIPEMWVVVRTNGEPASIGDAIRRIVREVDRAVPVSDVRTMTAVAAESVRKTRFVTTLVGAFALLSIVLGAVGIYGVMSYLVGQRTREMGIRIALGASSAGVMGLVVGRALRLALLGTAVGVIAAFFATRSLRQWLYGVSATDPVTFFAVPLLFLGVAALASSAPALRATRVDPAASLKAD